MDKPNINNVNSRTFNEDIFKSNYEKEYNKIIEFNNEDIKFSEKCYRYYVLNNNETPICRVCNKNKLKFISFNKGYRSYCSYKCLNNSKDKKNKVKSTNIERYGTENPFQSEEIKNKIKEEWIKKYGVDNPAKSDKVKDKIKSTNLKKYGTESHLTNGEIRNKIKSTNLKKYGTENPFQSEEIKDKIKSTNLKRYGEVFFQSTDIFKNNVLIKKLEELNIKNYKICKNKIEYKCNKCGNTHTYNRDYMLKRIRSSIELCLNLMPYSNKNESLNEIEIFNFIKKHCNYEIITKKRILDGKEIDIYIPELKLGIEYNGLYWHSELFKDKQYHLEKTRLANEKGIQLIHIWEDDWVYKKDIVKSMILNKLGKSRRIYARKCEVKEINSKDYKNFLENNHLQSFAIAKIRLGLYYNNVLVSIMSFSKPRVNLNMKKLKGYELLRFCNKLNTTVIGGASKLLKHFINNYQYDSIISFANSDISNGNLYEKIGFNLDGYTKPGYYWCKNGLKFNRYKFRKSKLVKEGYDIDKSEFTIMTECGYNRVWDSGNIRYIMNKPLN